MALYGLFEARLAAMTIGPFGIVEYAVVTVSCAWLAWYSLRSSMREDFRVVRESIARARAVPA